MGRDDDAVKPEVAIRGLFDRNAGVAHVALPDGGPGRPGDNLYQLTSSAAACRERDRSTDLPRAVDPLGRSPLPRAGLSTPPVLEIHPSTGPGIDVSGPALASKSRRC